VAGVGVVHEQLAVAVAAATALPVDCPHQKPPNMAFKPPQPPPPASYRSDKREDLLWKPGNR
jgi:hypothetical protein